MISRLLLPTLLFGTLPLSAQVLSLPGAASKVAQNATSRGNALDLFKAGNPVAGLVALQGGVKKGVGVDSDDTQVATELCSIARTLMVTQHSAGPSTAALAATELAKARSKARGREAISLDFQAGDLYERIIGDRQKARTFYQAVLAQEPKHLAANEGLNRIAYYEAAIQARARENSQLRSRSK